MVVQRWIDGTVKDYIFGWSVIEVRPFGGGDDCKDLVVPSPEIICVIRCARRENIVGGCLFLAVFSLWMRAEQSSTVCASVALIS